MLMRRAAWTLIALVGATATLAHGAEPAGSAALIFHELRAADGIPLNVVEAGNPQGPPVVFLHGAYQSYLSWLGQLRDPALARDFRLVALDLRGHGGSGKPWDPAAYAGSRPWAEDLKAIMAQLRIEKPVLVGWSFGGYVIMDYVREFSGDDLAGAMLVGSYGGLPGRPPGSGNRPPGPDGNLEVLRQGAREFAAAMFAQPQPDAVVDRVESAFLMTPAYARRAMAGKRIDNSDLASRVTVPLLFVVGTADPIVAHEQVRVLSSGLPAAGFVRYEGSGHSPFIEATARFNADLRCFVMTRAACQASGRDDP
jgi:pimeloyl-ACP methyl ester carboxylesterase